jgi:hypothetical protein
MLKPNKEFTKLMKSLGKDEEDVLSQIREERSI